VTNTSPSGITFHVTPEAVWRAHDGLQTYDPERFAEEGFVHCTDGEEFLLEVANRYYRNDPRPYVVLDVDLGAVRANAIYEDEARRYPHVYGPIERAAVRRVRRLERRADGTFTGYGEAIEA
jgi:uncharacterized protein (DUF952 family)